MSDSTLSEFVQVASAFKAKYGEDTAYVLHEMGRIGLTAEQKLAAMKAILGLNGHAASGTGAGEKPVTLADIRRFFGNVTWLWPGHIPYGHVTLIVGETGIGKSWLSASLIASFLGVRPWPDGTQSAGEGNVLLLETEQMRGAYAERLAELGVPDDKVLLLPTPDGLDVPNELYTPDLIADEGRIIAFCSRHNVGLIVVDSLSGGHDLDENSAQMRVVLQALARIAATLGIPVVVVHHTRKKSAFEAAKITLDRVRGSSAIVQYGRVVFGLWKPDGAGQAVRVDCLKSNFAKPFESFGFVISDGVAFVAAPEEERQPTAVDKAVEFLRAKLRKGPMSFNELLELAESEGISRTTLYRAKDVLNVVAAKGQWALPASEP